MLGRCSAASRVGPHQAECLLQPRAPSMMTKSGLQATETRSSSRRARRLALTAHVARCQQHLLTVSPMPKPPATNRCRLASSRTRTTVPSRIAQDILVSQRAATPGLPIRLHFPLPSPSFLPTLLGSLYPPRVGPGEVGTAITPPPARHSRLSGSASLRHSPLVPSASLNRARGTLIVTAPNEPSNWRARAHADSPLFRSPHSRPQHTDRRAPQRVVQFRLHKFSMNSRTRSRIIASIGSNQPPRKSPATCPTGLRYPSSWCNLHRRLTAESGSFHKPEITPL